MTTLTQSELDDLRRKAEQPFEKYAALAASIGVLATHAGGISLIEWDNHLAQINAVIAHLTAEIDQAAGVIEDRNKEIADLISDLDTAKSNTGAACARIAELEAHPSAQFVAGKLEGLRRAAEICKEQSQKFLEKAGWVRDSDGNFYRVLSAHNTESNAFVSKSNGAGCIRAAILAEAALKGEGE